MVQASQWCVLIPVSTRSVAKSRLQSMGEQRIALAEAFLHDVISRLTASRTVARVLVVGDGTLGRDAAGSEWFDSGQQDLNGSLVAAEAAVRASGTANIAVIVADLPCATTDDFEAFLSLARAQQRAFVSDHTGQGTTILASTGPSLRPHFGDRSAAAHRASGAADIEAVQRLRLDVDVPADLTVALVYGVGPNTSEALSADRASF